MDEGLPIIGILILNRNGKDWLASIYESLRNNNYSKLRTYLVDNASTDGSIELTRESYSEVTVIRMPKNLGYCMAYNLAMPHTFADGCDWVIWANNDVRIEPNCLSELARIAQSDPKIGVIGPGFLAWEKEEPNYYMLGNHPHAISAMRSKSPEPIDVEWVEGSFLMVSRRCVESVGPLDPYLFFYWEETDFCRRARYKGWRVVLVPSALARHYAGGWSAGDQQNKAEANWLQSRNYYIYKLANPFQGFVRNIREALHLFLVNINSNKLQLMSLIGQIRIFVSVIRDIQTIQKKWARDRAGIHPPVSNANLPVEDLKVICQMAAHPSANSTRSIV